MIRAVYFSTIAHSTEDESKVRAAIAGLAPQQLRSSLPITSSAAQGHHGNPIFLIQAVVDDKKVAREIVDYLLKMLPVGDRLRMRDRILTFYDGQSNVFLRLSKQMAFLGVARLSDEDDVIRVRIGINVRKNDLSSVLEALALS
ncbi:MAG TPA: RNA-binding domain-containing protein [Candidatus Methanomethylicus sp.]|jgi:RNA binding exosome subunit|nr:RNA-binding domain-containing protein [Candidatus Methanomethylicus sp.]